MTEEEIKAFCKFLIDYGKHDFTELEKELLKQAVDRSHNWNELLAVAMTVNRMDKYGEC